MTAPVRSPYIHAAPTLGNAGWMPFLPITLSRKRVQLADLALVDSGSSTNILPYNIGLQLGFDWNQIVGHLPLGGMLANHPAKPVLLEAVVASFPPVLLAFAWAQGPVPRTLLGQTNFFMEFDISFYRARGYFNIQPASAATP